MNGREQSCNASLEQCISWWSKESGQWDQRYFSLNGVHFYYKIWALVKVEAVLRYPWLHSIWEVVYLWFPLLVPMLPNFFESTNKKPTTRLHFQISFFWELVVKRNTKYLAVTPYVCSISRLNPVISNNPFFLPLLNKWPSCLACTQVSVIETIRNTVLFLWGSHGYSGHS